MGWEPIETAPECKEVVVLLDDGRQAIAEYWPAPPIELDPRQEFGGWAICLIGSGPMDLGLDCGEIGNPIGWKPKETPDDQA